MHLLVLQWPYALVFWGVFLWAFTREARIVAKRAPPSARTQDAGSKMVIAVGQAVALQAAFMIAVLAPSGTLPHRGALFWIGVAAMIAGALLRRHCFRMLGGSFTADVVVRSDQIVVERGAYRYVRHPSYTAGAILFLGIGLALANWIALAELMLIGTSVYGYRVVVEERMLLTTIGDPYRRYMRRTKRFLPFLF